MAKGEITVKVNLEMTEDAKELIRQIVREEIAAHEGRLMRKIGEIYCSGSLSSFGDVR